MNLKERVFEGIKFVYKPRKAKRHPEAFTVFSKKQKQVFTWWHSNSPVSDKKAIIAHGAVRSGKTLSLSVSYVIWAMTMFDNKNFGMAGKTVGSFRRNVVNPLKLRLFLRGYKVKDKRADNALIITKNGISNTFYLFGGSDESSQDTVQGLTASGFFFDEVALMPETFVAQCMARCISEPTSKYWFNCNPDSPFHWFKVNFIDKAQERNYLVLHFLMRDNPTLTEEAIEQAEKDFIGIFYDRYILGLWVLAEGIVYDMFKREVHEKPVSFLKGIKFYETVVAIDYGTANPTTFKKWQRYGENKWLNTREYVHNGRTTSQKSDMAYADDLDKFLEKEISVYDDEGNFLKYERQRVEIILDPSALSFRVVLKERGYRVTKAKNNVLAGIRTMMTRIEDGSMSYLCGRYPETLKEFSAYSWDAKASKRGEDKVIKDHDHCLDADRYFSYTKLRIGKGGLGFWK